MLLQWPKKRTQIPLCYEQATRKKKLLALISANSLASKETLNRGISTITTVEAISMTSTSGITHLVQLPPSPPSLPPYLLFSQSYNPNKTPLFPIANPIFIPFPNVSPPIPASYQTTRSRHDKNCISQNITLLILTAAALPQPPQLQPPTPPSPPPGQEGPVKPDPPAAAIETTAPVPQDSSWAVLFGTSGGWSKLPVACGDGGITTSDDDDDRVGEGGGCGCDGDGGRWEVGGVKGER